MTHEEVLNKLLAHCCGKLCDAETAKNGGIQHYVLDLHCCEYLVQAKPLGNGRYEIVAIETSFRASHVTLTNGNIVTAVRRMTVEERKVLMIDLADYVCLRCGDNIINVDREDGRGPRPESCSCIDSD